MHKHFDEHFKETYYSMTLSNGMHVVFLPKSSYHTTYVSLSVPYGNHHLNFKANGKNYQLPIGSAHFFEHKIYASEEGDMFAKFVQFGIEPNAYTSYEYTSYIFNATSYVKEGIQLLFDTLDKTYFTEDNISTERDIINEEIHMNDDKSSTKMYRHLYNMMFFHHPIKEDILGTKESIQNIDVDTLHLMHRYFYQKNQRLLVVAGKVNINDLEIFLNEYDSKEEPLSFDVIPIVEPRDIVEKEKDVYENIEKPRLAMGFKLQHTMTLEEMEIFSTSIYIALHAYIGQSSLLYQSLLDDKLIYKDLHYFVQKELGAESVVIFASSKDPKTLKNRLIEILNEPIEKVLTHDIFIRLKNVSLAASIEMLDDMENKVYLFTKYELDHLNMYDVMKKKLSITYEDVINSFQLFKASLVSSLYMYPKTKS